jgi:hypothetical protein
MTIGVAVSGSRHLQDVGVVSRALDRICAEEVIVGDCPTGADYFAREWCAWRGVRCHVIRADWRTYGKAAGPRRNLRLVRKARELGAQFLLAFPRGGPGTQNAIFHAERQGLAVRKR